MEGAVMGADVADFGTLRSLRQDLRALSEMASESRNAGEIDDFP